MNSLKEIDINNCTYYFFDVIVSIKNLDLKTIKIYKNSYKTNLTYHIRYVIFTQLLIV